jgi:hypothetical protein
LESTATLRVRQAQQAVDAAAVRERRLHLESRGGQDIAHQRLELHLAEGAARALVAQQLLQADDAAGEALDLLLRLVDGGQPLHHRHEGLVGLAEALVQPLVHLAGDLVEALVDLGVQRARRVGQLLGHGELQRVQRVARAGELLPQHAAQPVARVVEARADAVALGHKAGMQLRGQRFDGFLQVTDDGEQEEDQAGESAGGEEGKDDAEFRHRPPLYVQASRKASSGG